jgi:SAM-dependent methyltransferase
MSGGLRFDEATARGIEVLYRSPDAMRRRSRVLELLRPRSGERVLDVGCGPGFLASELGAAVGPSGAVEALDNSDAMLELARARCAGAPWVRIRHGDAERLDAAPGAFDAAVSVQVHEYVKDVAGSLAALARALRPGGRALVVATDWDSLVWHASDAERMRRVLSAFDEHLADPHLPRRLAPLLAGAGLAVTRCEALVQLNEFLDPNTFSSGLLELIRRFVPGRRGVSREEADAWAEDLRELGRRGEYFFSLNQYVFLASRR